MSIVYVAGDNDNNSVYRQHRPNGSLNKTKFKTSKPYVLECKLLRWFKYIIKFVELRHYMGTGFVWQWTTCN